MEATGFVWPLRVYYEDTDCGGVVYYANYLRFMERARTEWLRDLGFQQADLAEGQGALFVVRSVSVEYHRPARFDDLLEVVTRVEEARRASLVLEQRVRRGAEVLVSARVRVACVEVESFRPRSIPGPVLKEMVGER